MRSQDFYPSSNSDSFLVVKISKRSAFFLFVGLLAIAAAIAFRPMQTTGSKADDIVTPAPTIASPQEPSPTPPLAGDSRESRIEAQTAQRTEPVSPRNETTSNPEPVSAVAPTPPVRSPAVTVVHHIVTYYPAEPPTSAAPSDPSPSSDAAPAEQPGDPTPPSSPAQPPEAPAPPSSVTPAIVTGAGSTSSYELYSKWFAAFHEQHPDVQFNYQAVGSGAGLKRLFEGTVDFGAVDAPLSDQQLKLAKVAVVHVPSAIGGVVVAYNLFGLRDLRLTPRILAGIFTGKITSWNDPQIAAYNPEFSRFPEVPITVIHRSDGCSSTQIFSNYLSKISGEWQRQVGEGTSINWPLGLAAKGNEGVSQLLRQHIGAITFVDFPFAMANHMDSAMLQNRSGHFVKADLHSLSLAAASSAIPDDFRVWITNAPGGDAYPIASFIWFLAPDHDPSEPETRDFAEFLRWTTRRDPQTMAARLNYAPLPEELLERVNRVISRIQ